MDGLVGIDRIRLRWVGHRLSGDALVTVDAPRPDAADPAERSVREHLPTLDDFLVRVRTPGS